MNTAMLKKLTTLAPWKSIDKNPPPLGVTVSVRGEDFMGYWYQVAKAELKGDAAFQKKLSGKAFSKRVRWIMENGKRMEDAPEEWIETPTL